MDLGRTLRQGDSRRQRCACRGCLQDLRAACEADIAGQDEEGLIVLAMVVLRGARPTGRHRAFDGAHALLDGHTIFQYPERDRACPEGLPIPARELLLTGGPLTVQAVAERSGVSRATAYRYLPSNEAVALHATMPITDDPLTEADWAETTRTAGADLPARAAALVRRMGEWAFDNERQLRILLRLSLTDGSGPPALARRPSTSRDRWIAALLADLPDSVPPGQGPPGDRADPAVRFRRGGLAHRPGGPRARGGPPATRVDGQHARRKHARRKHARGIQARPTAAPGSRPPRPTR